jgi:SAM-dependent methyltransferase
MTNINPRQAYHDHVARLQREIAGDAALMSAVGGDFIAMGKLEYYLLLSLGLTAGDYVIDVGCGSGRLACQLAAMDGLRYLGTDIVPQLLECAQRLSRRPDWRFHLTDGTSIPGPEGTADMVCFFSVFTHLLHEDSYSYLVEARRVLKPGGRIVFSFLEFRIPYHWSVFEHSVAHRKSGQHLNQFMARDGIHAWAQHLGLDVELIADGDKPHIPVPEEIRFDHGTVMQELGNLGQSVAVLVKPRS